MNRYIPNEELRIIDLTLRMFIERPFEVDRHALEDFKANEVKHRYLKIVRAGLVDRVLNEKVLASNDQFAKWIIDQGIDFNKVPSPTPKNPAHEKWPLDKDCDEFKALRVDYPDFAPVWEARLAVSSNINITRATRILDNSSKGKTNELGRMGFLLQTYGAGNTLRWSGSNKVNGQNLTKGTALRTSLRAPEGFVIAVHDQSNIEARLLAWFAQEEELLDDYANAVDSYSKFASGVYGYHVSKDTPTERFVGKTCILGLGYQMGARRLRNTLAIGMGGRSVHLSFQEAQKLVWKYRQTYSAIVRLWHEAGGILQSMIHLKEGETQEWRGLTIRRHSIVLPNGMVLSYPGIKVFYDQSTGEGEIRYKGKDFWVKMFPGKLVENIIQALARIVIAKNLLDADDVLRSLESHGMVALLVHDEVVTIVEGGLADDYMRLQSERMRTPPDWCNEGGLILDVEGGYDVCYSK